MDTEIDSLPAGVVRLSDALSDVIRCTSTLARLVDALDQRTAAPPGSTALPPLMSAEDTAKVLDVARSTVYSWDQSGLIPGPVRIGARTFWRGSELEAWIAAGCPCRERWKILRKDG